MESGRGKKFKYKSRKVVLKFEAVWCEVFKTSGKIF